MPIRIGIDAIHISRQGKGISRLQRGLLQGLAEEPPAYEYVIYLNGRTEQPALPQPDHFRYVRVHPPNLLTWELTQLPRLAQRERLGLVQTMSDRLPIFGSTPFVMFLSEVPDYRRELARVHGGLYQRASDLVTRLIFPRSLRRAALVIVPSQFTKDDLLSRYQVSPDKVRVVHESADQRFVPRADANATNQVRAGFGVSGRYILHFSSHNDPRDNTPTVLRAAARALPALDPNVQLVIAGDLGSARPEIERDATALGLNGRVVFTGYMFDPELVALYQGAAVYVDPSRYEGFGLQVLEAMASGVPVVCSNTTSLPELVGDAALTCSPMDAEGFGHALGRVLLDGRLASEMRTKGLARARSYSWRATARALVALYDEVLA